jgi:hypothetical protein
LHSLNYDNSLTRFITSSSILRHRLESKVPILRFHLKLLDFLELPPVKIPSIHTSEREVRWSDFSNLTIEKSLSTVELPGNTVLSPPAKYCK